MRVSYSVSIIRTHYITSTMMSLTVPGFRCIFSKFYVTRASRIGVA